MFAVAEVETSLLPNELKGGGRGSLGSLGAALGTEGVSRFVNGPNDLGTVRGITERGPQLRHQARQAGTRHVNLRPQELIELVVGDHRGSALDQDLEQFVHL